MAESAPLLDEQAQVIHDLNEPQVAFPPVAPLFVRNGIEGIFYKEVIIMSAKHIILPTPIQFLIKRNLADYTKPELDYILERANFTEDELEYFNLRSKGKSNVAITIAMMISDSKLHEIRRKVESKINRIL
jgi:hypothetical protein